MDQRSYLRREIAACRRKMNWARLFDFVVFFAAAFGVCGAACELVSLFVPFYYAHTAAILCFLAAIPVGAAAALIRRADMRAAARRLDGFGLKERMVTAYELMDREDELACRQREDACTCYERARERIRIPLLPGRRRMIAFLLTAAAALALSFVPSAARDAARVRHEVKTQAKEETKKIDELAKALDAVDAESLTEEQQEALRQLMESLQLSREELNRADSKEGLNAALARLDYKYEQAGQSLSKLAAEMANPSAAGVADAAALAKALANKGEQTANAGNAGAGGSAGDGSDGSDGANGSNGGSGDGEGGSGEGSDGEGSGSGNGNGSVNGEGSGEGNGSGNGNGSGSGEGSGNGFGNGNGNGEGSGGGRGTGSSNQTHDYVSIPNKVGNDEAVSGNRTDSDDSDYYRQQNGLAWTGEHVDYSSVIGDYTDRAYEGLATGRYPSGLESVIKDYFESLNR